MKQRRPPAHIKIKGNRATIHLCRRIWYHRNLWHCAQFLGFGILLDLWEGPYAENFRGKDKITSVVVLKNRIPVCGSISPSHPINKTIVLKEALTP